MTLPVDLAAAVTRAGIDATAEPKVLAPALEHAMADRRGYLGFDVDAPGWPVDPLSPEAETFRGRMLAEALVWCSVWWMTDELTISTPA